MKILICAYDRPGQVATGPNAWLQRLVPDLRTRYQLDVHTLFIYQGIEDECPTLSFFKEQQLPVSTINKEQWPYVADQVKTLLTLVKALQINVVVANLVIPALYATHYLKKAHIPVIGVLHSQDPFYKGVIHKFIHGAPEDRLTAVVPVSNFIAKLVEKKGVAIDNCMISCGVPLQDKKAKWNKKAPLKIIYAGRLVVEAKQILKLTTAFCNASQIRQQLEFSIYGDGDEEAAVKNTIESHKAQRYVKLYQAVSPAEILNTMVEHQVFTLMSDYEGMPVALMEAMACGVVPVCYINEGGVNEIIEHGVNGFIVKDREADYQKHLQLLLDQPELWERLSANAVKTIKERYSSAITHEQWYRLLNGYTAETIKSLKIPSRIKLEGPLLHYGDNRKPGRREVYLQKLQRHWMKVRLFVRPRARLRALLNK